MNMVMTMANDDDDNVYDEVAVDVDMYLYVADAVYDVAIDVDDDCVVMSLMMYGDVRDDDNDFDGEINVADDGDKDVR